MRADRLVAAMLILQARGRVSASELATELEVSPRTARRDLEALAMAGVPVYSTPGRKGGWSLLGGGRIDLSGLTSKEARALFLVASPRSLRSPEARSALRKVVRALPNAFRQDVESAAAAVHLEPGGWGGRDATPDEHLEALERAVVDGEQVRLGYADGTGRASVRTVHPLGLIEHGRVWYLLARTAAGLRTYRLSRVTNVERTGDPVERPVGFDLETAWREAASRIEARRASVRAAARVTAVIVPALQRELGNDLTVTGSADDGRTMVEITGPSAEIIADELAGWGRDIEVLEPDDVRQHLARLGRELVALYEREPRAVGRRPTRRSGSARSA